MMKRLKVICTIFAAFLLSSCASSYIATSWKASNTIPRSYSKIMVVGIINSADTALRRQVEDYFVNDLRNSGYNTVSALEEYGPKGFANLAQETTYLKLCERGIDAIITVALLDKTKKKNDLRSGDKYYSSLYFYNHIWNYKNLQADLTDTSGLAELGKRFFLESIVFDLQTLQPVYVVQTKSFNAVSFIHRQEDYERMIVKSIRKRKVMIKPSNMAIKPVRAF